MDFFPRIICPLRRNVDKNYVRVTTQANIAHNPHLSKGLSLFHNSRCSWSAVRLCSAQLSKGQAKGPAWKQGMGGLSGRYLRARPGSDFLTFIHMPPS